MTAASPVPSPIQTVPASVVDDAAFEAFASCSFQEAARLAVEELVQHKEPHQDDSQATTLKRPTQGVSLPCSLPDGEIEKEGGKPRILIRLQEHCARSDKLAAILVQCAYELKQEAEESLFVQHYTTQGSIPFPVALIWLQVCLAKGGAHYGTVRRVLMQLLVALEEEKGGLLQPSPAKSDKEEAQLSSPQPQEEGGDEVEKDKNVAAAPAAAAAAAAVEGEGEDGLWKEEDEAEIAVRRRSLVGMYGQAMELLVLKVMLALGEGEAALERVRGDKHLEGRVRQTLLDACQASLKRQRAATPPTARRSSTGKREEQRGARGQAKGKKDASASSSSSSLAARSTVLSAPSSSMSSQTLTTTTSSSNVTPRSLLTSSMPSSLSGFLRTLWGGNRSQTTAWTPSSSSSSSSSSRTASPSSSSLSASSSSPRTLRQQLLTSSPHQLLLSFLGFVALALGFHLRRGLGMGSRALAQRAARLLQRIVTMVLVGGEKTTTGQ